MTITVDAASLVDRLIERLADTYVFPERAAQAASLLRARLEQGAYQSTLGPELCETISADLFEASSDKHLRLLWHESPEQSGNDAELVAAFREQLRLENHGVRRVELMPENIGLIELTIIPDASAGGPNLVAAMQLVQHTRALIIDLRRARGGAPDGVALLASYLFADGDVHLSDLIQGPHGPPASTGPSPISLVRATSTAPSTSSRAQPRSPAPRRWPTTCRHRDERRSSASERAAEPIRRRSSRSPSTSNSASPWHEPSTRSLGATGKESASNRTCPQRPTTPSRSPNASLAR